MGKNTCKPGVVANQLQSCPDISATGIQSITQSANGLYLYITLTNGTTQAFTLTPGPAGANGATGATGATGANGATGAAGANGTSVLYNDLTGSTSQQALKTFALPANTLTVNGSKIVITTRVEIELANTVAVQVNLGGIALAVGVYDELNVSTNAEELIYEIHITKTGTGTGTVLLKRWLTDGVLVLKTYMPDPVNITPDWTIINNIQTLVTADVAVNGCYSQQLEVDLYIL